MSLLVDVFVEEHTPRTGCRPFLKWAGGKYSLLPDLYQLIPAGMRLIEPFVGGGSVFLNSDNSAWHTSFQNVDYLLPENSGFRS